MKKHIGILGLIFILISCDTSVKNQNLVILKEEIKAPEKQILTVKKQENKECLCFDGIGSQKGDKPIRKIYFSNGIELSICGYYEPEEQTGSEIFLSEFDVFNCKTKKSYARYGALDDCSINIKKDTIIINKYDLLKVIENGEWVTSGVITSKQTLTIKSDSINVSKIFPAYKPTGYQGKTARDFLSQLEKLRNFGPHENWEENILKLEFLSLEGSEKAFNFLKKYDSITNYIASGVYAEELKNSIKNVEWIKSYIPNDCVFDTTTQNDEFLENISEFENYKWFANDKTAKVKYGNDSIEIYKGGCDHYSTELKVKILKDTVDYSKWNNILKKIIPIAKILKDEFSYNEVLKALENKNYEIESLENMQTLYFQDEYLKQNNYSIYQVSEKNNNIIGINSYMD